MSKRRVGSVSKLGKEVQKALLMRAVVLKEQNPGSANPRKLIRLAEDMGKRIDRRVLKQVFYKASMLTEERANRIREVAKRLYKAGKFNGGPIPPDVLTVLRNYSLFSLGHLATNESLTRLARSVEVNEETPVVGKTKASGRMIPHQLITA